MKLFLLKVTALAMAASHGANAHELHGSSAKGGLSAFTNIENSDQCEDLGETAAEFIVFSNVCIPDMANGYGSDHRDYMETCRRVAYGICEGQIPSKVREYCPDDDLNTSEMLKLQDECEEVVDDLTSGGEGNKPTRKPTKKPTGRRPSSDCVDDESPRPVLDGYGRYRFNLLESNAQCVDENDELYEYGEFENVREFSECADACVKDVRSELLESFRGYDWDCRNEKCRCLYDAGTLDSRNSDRFDRTNRDKSGEGSIEDAITKDDFYCAKLAGAEFVDGNEDQFEVEAGRTLRGSN